MSAKIFLKVVKKKAIMSSPSEYADAKGLSPRSLPKQKFTEEDDQKLREIINEIGTKSWPDIAAAMGNRNARQCKERWENYLSPSINNSPFTPEEDQLLLQKQKEIGSKWVQMRNFFDRRTDAALKNRWQMLIRKQKKLQTLSIKKSSQLRKKSLSYSYPTPVNIEHKRTISPPIVESLLFPEPIFEIPSLSSEYSDDIDCLSTWRVPDLSSVYDL